MNLATACFEIVQFSFSETLSLQEQTEVLRQIGHWARRQPGFRGRQSYHDPHANRWTDVVEWDDMAHAEAAMARSQQDAALLPLMARIDPGSVRVGHFERHL